MLEFLDQINILKEELANLVKSYDIPKNKQKIAKLEEQSSAPNFWTDREKAQNLMQELADLKEDIGELEDLGQKLNELTQLKDLVKNPKEEKELNDELLTCKKITENLKQKAYLSGPYDKLNVILSIHAGQGGTEACDWAQMLQRMYERYFEKKNWKKEVLEERSGEEAGIKSVTMLVKGRFAYGFLKNERGTHRLVRLSPYNADNLRQTSFALVQVLPFFAKTDEIKINPDDVKVSFSRSSGHGGQNVNKVSTAVHLKHIPSGIAVDCQAERSQEQNRKIAMSLLQAKLWEKKEASRQEKIKNIRGDKKMASWGTQIRSYVLHPYKMVKDLRTGYEERDPDKVLDGNIDEFIKKALQLKLS